jgi:hypothetical protein
VLHPLPATSGEHGGTQGNGQKHQLSLQCRSRIQYHHLRRLVHLAPVHPLLTRANSRRGTFLLTRRMRRTRTTITKLLRSCPPHPHPSLPILRPSRLWKRNLQASLIMALNLSQHRIHHPRLLKLKRLLLSQNQQSPHPLHLHQLLARIPFLFPHDNFLLLEHWSSFKGLCIRPIFHVQHPNTRHRNGLLLVWIRPMTEVMAEPETDYLHYCNLVQLLAHPPMYSMTHPPDLRRLMTRSRPPHQVTHHFHRPKNHPRPV